MNLAAMAQMMGKAMGKGKMGKDGKATGKGKVGGKFGSFAASMSSKKAAGAPFRGAKPDKFSGELWEQPRVQTSLKLISEEVPQELVSRGTRWQYVLSDENRRSYAAYLKCPFSQDQTHKFFADV